MVASLFLAMTSMSTEMPDQLYWLSLLSRVQEAIRAFKSHVLGHGNPNWEAFMNDIFGPDVMLSMKQKLTQANQETEATPALAVVAQPPTAELAPSGAPPVSGQPTDVARPQEPDAPP